MVSKEEEIYTTGQSGLEEHLLKVIKAQLESSTVSLELKLFQFGKPLYKVFQPIQAMKTVQLYFMRDTVVDLIP